ncbi:MAG: 2-hydroxychromene-2-carboxylate isomerase [Pseudorhodoplanes sp.]|uniref:2-hydroxychromene-2-carboxylate isomerase n=1 Tax=Pseudorhodoplanes sp. TaxID=1934341 RepID=UPI003D0AB7FE
MSKPCVDFWFDFASTYSYPACMRAQALRDEAGVAIRYRPFLLGPVFKAQGWATSPFNIYEAKGRYMWRDLERLCAELSIPFRRPDPFPQNSLLAARAAIASEGDSWHDAFCKAVFRVQFGEGRSIEDPVVIEAVLHDIGAPARLVLERAQSDPVKLKLRSETEEAGRLGIFGAPSFVTADGELFWGNDRLESALAWARRTA